MSRPVIYLDIDGVLNVVRLSLKDITRDTGFAGFRMQKTGYQVLRHSTEVQARLNALHEHADIIWASLNDVDRSILGIPSEGSFQIVNEGLEHSGKLEAILADQSENPRPFIWVDDEEARYYDLATERGALPALEPHLLIRPRTDRGITAGEMEQIEAFVHQHADLHPSSR